MLPGTGYPLLETLDAWIVLQCDVGDRSEVLGFLAGPGCSVLVTIDDRLMTNRTSLVKKKHLV